MSSDLNRLCTDVRNVPQDFHRLWIDLRHQLEIAQEIQAHYLPTFATAVESSAFDMPLIKYITIAD